MTWADARKPHQVVAFYGSSHRHNTDFLLQLAHAADGVGLSVTAFRHNEAKPLPSLPERCPPTEVPHLLVATASRRHTLLSLPDHLPAEGPHADLSLADAAVWVQEPGGSVSPDPLDRICGCGIHLAAVVILRQPGEPLDDERERSIRMWIEHFDLDANELHVVTYELGTADVQLLEILDRTPPPATALAEREGPGWMQLWDFHQLNNRVLALARVYQGRFDTTVRLVSTAYYSTPYRRDNTVTIHAMPRIGEGPLVAGDLHLMHVEHRLGPYFRRGLFLLTPNWGRRTHFCRLDLGYWKTPPKGLLMALVHGNEVPVSVTYEDGFTVLASQSPMYFFPGSVVELRQGTQTFGIGKIVSTY